MRDFFLTSENGLSAYGSIIYPYIEKRRENGFFDGYDGQKLHYSVFKADDPHGCVVIVHGFTECIEKYRELIYYFLHAGLSVAVYEQRGHGYSFRYNDDKQVVHIKKFDEYVDDLDFFTDSVVSKIEGPYYLFAHSMGGAVASLYLENKKKDFFKKAILSSPMIAPQRGGFPLWFSKFVARTFILLGQSKKRIFISKPEQIPDYCKDPSAYGVLSRRQQQDLLKFSDENYMTNGPSYRWMLESLLVTKKILARGKPEGITIPVLLCQAQNDMLVINSAQDSFVARVPNATKYEASGSQHEIYNETDEISIPYFDTILDYLTNT